MKKKCLFLTTLLFAFQLVCIQPSWSAEPNENNKLLASALKDLQQTIIEKIEHEADTTATAFADAENIDRDLRLKDIFRTPLVIIEETINTISSLVNAGKIAETANRVLNSSETNLQIVSGIMTLSTLKQVGEDLQLAIDGPSYCSTIEEMLDKAYRRSSTRLQKSLIRFNPTAYKNIINLYLYAQYEPGPLRIPHKSSDLTRRNLDIASGTYKIERNIRERFRALRDKLEDNPLSPDPALEAINQIEKIKRAIMASKGLYQKLSYQTYLKDETGNYLPNTVDLELGTIAELEKVRQIALANSDKEMKIEQVTTISKAVRAGIQATALHIRTTYKSPKTGEILGELQKWSLIPLTIEVALFRPFDTSAREQVNMIPQEMMMTLPLELSNVWMVADDTASYIEYLIETQKQPPKEVSRGIPAEIRLQDKSIIKGEILQEKIKIKTKYGEMDIPVEKFVSIIGQLIELKDGTTLKGNFAEKTLRVKTDYGRLKVETKDIDFITFAKEGKPPIKEPLPPHKEKIPIPEYHGMYLVSGRKLIALEESRRTMGVVHNSAIWGIRALSGTDVSDEKAYIILYGGMPQLLKLARLKYVRTEELKLPLLGTIEAVEMWLVSRNVKLKVAPIEDKKDMYRLIPTVPLTPGAYAIYSGDPRELNPPFDFTVNFKQSVSRSPNVYPFTTDTGEKIYTGGVIRNPAGEEKYFAGERMYYGIMWRLEVDFDKVPAGISAKELPTQIINRIKDRTKIFEDPNAENIFIYREFDTRILIQTYGGFLNPQSLMNLIIRTGHLEFKLIDEKADLSKALKGQLSPDHEILYDSKGRPYLVKKESLLHEETVEDAEVKIDQENQPYVVVKFNPEGTDKLSEITAKHEGKRLAIILDNVIKSAPVIKTRISSGHLYIQADSTREAQEIAIIIKSGSLVLPVNCIADGMWRGEATCGFSRGYVYHVKFENPIPMSSFQNLREVLNSKGMRWCIVQQYGGIKDNLYMIWIDLRGISAEINKEADKETIRYAQEELGLTAPIAPSVQQFLKRQGLVKVLSGRIEHILKDIKGQIVDVNRIEQIKGEQKEKSEKRSKRNI